MAVRLRSKKPDTPEPKLADLNIAVILPCKNEETAIAHVVSDVRSALPQASVYVYDNASTDKTAEAARAAGAHVRFEPTPGKGHVIRRAFADIEADIFLMMDGDGTYDIASAPSLIRTLLDQQLDMLVAARRQESDGAYRFGHQTGNTLFTWAFQRFFDLPAKDVLSGYRVFSRRFVKSFPSVAKGFEIEVEISAHAASMRLPVGEVELPYKERAEGSVSKLKTYSDGLKIARSMLSFLHAHRPTVIYGPIAAAAAILSLVIGLPVVFEYFETGLVPRFPTAFAAASVMVSALILAAVGLIQRKLARYHAEQKRLAYLAHPPIMRGAQT
ncbi:MAG: glycosyltransferase [Pseudomonadota bacterium]